MIEEHIKATFLIFPKTFPIYTVIICHWPRYYTLIIQQNHIKHFEFVSFVIDQLMLFKHLLKNWKHGKYYIIVKMLLHCPVQMEETHIINIDWNLIISAPNICDGFCLPHTQDDGLVFLWSLMWRGCVCVCWFHCLLVGHEIHIIRRRVR